MIRRSLALVALLTLFVCLGALIGLAVTVEVKTGSFYFEDSSVGDGKITAKVGDQLRFVIEDDGQGTRHTVEVPGLGISSGSLAVESVYVTDVLSESGEYEVFCRTHRNKGHETTLVVTETPATTTTTTTTTITTTTTTTPATTTTTSPGETTTTADSTTTTTTTTISGTPTTTLQSTTSTLETTAAATDSTTTTLESTTSTVGTAATTADPPTGDDEGESPTGEKPTAEATGETIALGESDPDTPVWVRVFPLASLALVLLGAIAVIAARRPIAGKTPEA